MSVFLIVIHIVYLLIYTYTIHQAYCAIHWWWKWVVVGGSGGGSAIFSTFAHHTPNFHLVEVVEVCF